LLDQTAAMVFEMHRILMSHGIVQYISDEIKYMDGLNLSSGGGIPIISNSSCRRLVDELKAKDKESHLILNHQRLAVPDGTGLIIVVHSKSKKQSMSKQLVLGLTEAEEDTLPKFAMDQ
jgi:hypothetical protein